MTRFLEVSQLLAMCLLPTHVVTNLGRASTLEMGRGRQGRQSRSLRQPHPFLLIRPSSSETIAGVYQSYGHSLRTDNSVRALFFRLIHEYTTCIYDYEIRLLVQ